MNEIDLFEAKRKFSKICERVAARGVAIVVTHRGKPLVKIEPIAARKKKPSSVWDLRAKFVKQHGPIKEDFTLPCRNNKT